MSGFQDNIAFLFWGQLLDALNEAITREEPYTFDYRGHKAMEPRELTTFLRGTAHAQWYRFKQSAEIRRTEPEMNELARLTDSIDVGRPLASNEHHVLLRTRDSETCVYCGQGLFDEEASDDTPGVAYAIDGHVIRATTACLAQEGSFAVRLKIDGQLAIGENFFAFADPAPSVPAHTPRDSVSIEGRRNRLRNAAERGIYFQAFREGESGVFLQENGEILVGDNRSPGTRIASADVIGDWDRSFADGARIPAETPGVARISVRPGIYEVLVPPLALSRVLKTQDDDEKESLYTPKAILRWVEEA